MLNSAPEVSDAIPYGRQNITDEDIEAVNSVLRSDYLTQGPKVAEFENAFASYVGSKHAIAAANGTAALHLNALALGVNENSKVLTTSNTFSASANCIRYCGGELDFADIDPNTFLIDLNQVEDKLKTGKYDGIIPVDFAGKPVNLEELKQLADRFGCWIIEDACHAPGASFTDSSGQIQKCGNGNFAELAIFSFHPVKHIACGEGGMITTNNSELYDKICDLRTHGITKDPDKLKENHGGWYYEMQQLGYNYRLSDIHCALGASQLSRADEGLRKRQEIADYYIEQLKDTSLLMPEVAKGEQHGWHLFVIRHHQRKTVYDHLKSNKIFAQVHYIPVHLQPYYREFGWSNGDLPRTEEYYSQCLSIPMFPTLTRDQQDFVIEKLKEVC